MTEYDFSPQDYERYFAKQNRVSNWVANAEEHRFEFRNALMVPPSVASSCKPRAADPAIPPTVTQRKSRTAPPSPRLSVSSMVLERGTPEPSGGIPNEPPAGPVPSRHSRHARSQSPSRSSSRPRSSSQPRDRKSEKSPTYIVTIPPTTSPTYVYGPSGWVPSAGLVILSSKRKKVSAMVRFPCTMHLAS